MSAAEEEKQDLRDADYQRDWEKLSPGVKKRLASHGIEVAPEKRNGMAMEFNENLSRVNDPGENPSFYVPDMADSIDTMADQLIEKYGAQHAAIITAVVADMKIPMEKEIERNRGLMLGRVVMYLVKSESNNMKARIHSLMHAIPRLAVINGFPSMRSSARACGVSCEWIRRSRDNLAEHLGLIIPEDGRKTPEAREKYKQNGLNNHWRDQTYNGGPRPDKPNKTIPCPKQLTPILKPQLAVA